MQTETLSTHTPALFAAAVERAAALLAAGEVVALPTETVYGLAANALRPNAVQRIFELKGRPAHNPIIVHVDGLRLARRCVAAWPTNAERLAAAFWPGPLTVVLPRADAVPDVVTAGGDTVGIRWPAHPFMPAVIRTCGFPLAAPSANLANRVSPTTAAHVERDFTGRIPLIVDGGSANVGIESTVVDLTGKTPRILRPGMIHEESLVAALDSPVLANAPSAAERGLRSPGMLPRHYAPRARLVVWSWADAAELRARLVASGGTPARTHVVTHTRTPAEGDFGRVSVVPHDPEAFARALYAELHRCDELGAELIVIETLPETPPWRGIADRLQRAAS